MKLNSFHHIAIIVSDLEKSKYFYTKILGFKIIAENFRKERNSFKLDLISQNNMRLEIFSFPNSPKRVSRPEACGLRHLAFSVSDILEEVKRLKKLNIVVEEIRVDEFTNQKFTFFEDPDGLPLELYEEKR